MAWSWFISVVALALFGWAVADLLRLGEDRAVEWVQEPAGPSAAPSAAEPIELHRLLPDATNALGRTVRLDGTVVGSVTRGGFWVRDLRDYIVFVAPSEVGPGRPEIRPGDVVRILGEVALLPAREQAERLQGAGLVLPASAIVVRDVKVLAPEGGVEVLAR